jgi:ParB family chromosome partitioning protein
MTNEHSSSPTIQISSIIITDRTRKDLGNINSLAESISSVGLMQPVVINENNELVDGQRRIKAYTQLGRTEIPFFRVNLQQIVLGEFHANSNRKDFTSSERVVISKAVERYLEGQTRRVGRPRIENHENSKAAEVAPATIIDECIQNSKSDANTNMINNTVNLTTFSSRSPSFSYKLTGRVKDNVAQYLGVSRNTLEKEKKIIDAAEEAPEQFGELRKKIDQGKISTDKAYNELQKQVKRNQILASARSSTINSSLKNVVLLHGDFRRQMEKIPDSSVDMIFTDPPYPKEYLPLYHDLAAAASRVLKSGGSLVTYANHCLVPEITKNMEDLGLNRQWILAVKLSGPFAHFHLKRVSVKWKPLLWFVKGNKTNSLDYISDFIESMAAEKASFEWEQNTIEAEHVISRLTVEDQTVCDPMMGEGTSGVAATKLGRRFVGIEINSERFDVAKARISKASVSEGNLGTDDDVMTTAKGGS